MSSEDGEDVTITRIFTFFFPYDTKSEESRRFENGHPNGHEIWGHGQLTGSSQFGDEAILTPSMVASSSISPIPYTLNIDDVKRLATESSLANSPDGNKEDQTNYLAVLISIYFVVVVVAFVLNVLLANALKRLRWGLKLALLFHMCIVGALLNVATSLHFISLVYHFVIQAKLEPIILEFFAVVAFIDNAIFMTLLFFVFILCLFCFFFYWNNRQRSIEWGRGHVVATTALGWLLAVAAAGTLATFEFDAHLHVNADNSTCVRYEPVAGNFFSIVVTELLSRLKLSLPIIGAVLLGSSVRVGYSRVRRQSLVKVEGSDGQGDREVFLIIALVFTIFEVFNVGWMVLQLLCLEAMLTIFLNHLLVVFCTLAAPIAVLSMSHQTRDRFLMLYTCHGKGRTAPMGSYVFTVSKYRDPNSGQDRVFSASSQHRLFAANNQPMQVHFGDEDDIKQRDPEY